MRARGYILLAACAYLVFVIYGSLVPLRMVPIPFDEALARFAQIRYLDLGIMSRADWVANLVLFVPLAFAWTAVLWRPGRRLWNAIAATLIAVLGCLLSIVIEFVQVYFPQRTVSINDIAAEALGALIGVGLFCATGTRVLAWIERWTEGRDPVGWAERVLYVYLGGLYLYSVMPLDLTLSPVEIFHKWREGRLLLVPFLASYRSLSEAVYDIGADVAIWIPVALLWTISGRYSAWAVWRRVTVAAVVLELLQVFVYSRVTDATDIVAAMIGGAIGVALGKRLSVLQPPTHAASASGAPTMIDHTPRAGPARHWMIWTAFMLGWMAMVALVFWFPFEVRIERDFVFERLKGLARMPFETYYFGSEYRALTEVLHKVLLFMPGGIALSWAVLKAPPGALRIAARLAAVCMIAGVALAIELGQVVMPSKVPDATDWFLETAGGWLGLFVGGQFLSRLTPRPAQPARSRSKASGRSRGARPSAARGRT